MKRFLPFSLFSSFLVAAWFLFSGHTDGVFGVQYSGGPANSGLDRTGGPLSGGQTCSACHSGGSGATSITFELLDSNNVNVTSYLPGAAYTAKFQVTSNLSIKGFQAVALRSGNLQAGTFTTIFSTQSTISTLAGRQYPEHQGSSGSGLFQFKWIAPAINSGNVTFYACGNGVNGNGGTSGDLPSSPISQVITETPTATFSYGTTDFCENDTDPTPTITGVTGGTFSAGAGLVVNATTGVIDLSASSVGTHTITYTYTNGIATQTVEILPTVASNESLTICSSDSVFLQGAWQNTAGTYVTNLQTTNGCDSVVTTVLSVTATSASSATATICQGESIVIGGTTYTTAGTYSFVVPNANGCDSTITTVLNVNSAYNNTINESICADDSVFFAGTWLSTPGMYTDNGTSTLGCDSITVLNLTVTPIDLTLTNTSPVLLANQTGATYKWLDCTAGFTAIPGETNQSFTATANGAYAVEITFQNCTDTSACETIGGIGLVEYPFGDIKLYPNPSSGNLGLVFSQSIQAKLSIYDLTGKLLFSDELNGVSMYSKSLEIQPGSYMVHLSNTTANTRMIWVVN